MDSIWMVAMDCNVIKCSLIILSLLPILEQKSVIVNNLCVKFSSFWLWNLNDDLEILESSQLMQSFCSIKAFQWWWLIGVIIASVQFIYALWLSKVVVIGRSLLYTPLQDTNSSSTKLVCNPFLTHESLFYHAILVVYSSNIFICMDHNVFKYVFFFSNKLENL